MCLAPVHLPICHRAVQLPFFLLHTCCFSFALAPCLHVAPAARPCAACCWLAGGGCTLCVNRGRPARASLGVCVRFSGVGVRLWRSRSAHAPSSPIAASTADQAARCVAVAAAKRERANATAHLCMLFERRFWRGGPLRTPQSARAAAHRPMGQKPPRAPRQAPAAAASHRSDISVLQTVLRARSVRLEAAVQVALVEGWATTRLVACTLPVRDRAGRGGA